jgi:hypothetical protein
MESPFDAYSNNNTITMFIEPILHPYTQTYQNIVTLNNIPRGPLANMVCRINTPKLSEFAYWSPNTLPTRRGGYCIYALSRYVCTSENRSIKNVDWFMGPQDIPAIFSYLSDNGYKIQTDLTKLIYKSNIDIGEGNQGSKKIICMFSYL